jgi:chitodextrinase
MSKALFVRSSLAAALTLGFAGCTVHSTPAAPDLAGPSTFARYLSVTATPDNIAADGSLSSITATLIGPDGKPLADAELQASIAVAGTPVDFGSLSQRKIYTNAAGQAKITYFAPIMNGFFAGTPAREVWVTMEQVGTNYYTVAPVHASIKVTPPPVLVLGVDSPVAAVTYAPTAPKVGQELTFDASGSTAASGHEIVNYFWDFGDGRVNDEHGNDASHVYLAAGTYIMVLGVTDEAGHSASTYKQIVVSK